MATLVFVLEDEREIVVPVMGTVSLGSADGNDVLVDDGSVSPTHAEISVSVTGGFLLRDLGSFSGTFVNGRRVRSFPLCDGDELSFGALRGRFILEDDDKAAMLERGREEEERKKRIEELGAAYDAALERHQTILGVLQGLGEEEKKRMSNLQRLQEAITAAEGELASAEVKAREAGNALFQEVLQEAELRRNIADLTSAHGELSTRHQDLTTSVQSLADKEKVLRDSLGRLEREVSAMEEKERKVNTSLAAATEAKKKLDAERKKLSAERTRLQNQVEKSQALALKHHEEQSALEARVKALASEARTAEAAATRLTDEEKRLRLSVEDLSRQHQAKVSALVASEAMLAASSSSLEQTKDEHLQIQASITSLTAGRAQAEEQLAKLHAEQANLTAALAVLERSVTDMERRQSDGLAVLREREGNLRRTTKEIEQALAERDKLQKDLQSQTDLHRSLSAEVQALVSKKSAAETRVGELQVLAQAREDQIRAAGHRLQQVEQRRKEIEQSITTLAGTEEHLLRARDELQKARTEHAELMAMVAARAEQERELESIRARVGEASHERAAVEARLGAEQAALKEFKIAAEAERNRVTAETQSLVQQCALEREKAAKASRQLQETTARNEELQRQNRKLEGVDDKLRESRTLLSQSETRNKELIGTIRAAEKEAEDARGRLGRLHAEVKSMEKSLEGLQSKEAELQRSLADVQAGHSAEKRRFEEMQKLAADAAREATTQRAAFDAMVEQRRREVSDFETRYHTMLALREEIDSRYAKLATLKQGSPEALALWQSTQEQKDSLAAMLPNEGGIRARPQARTVLVPRARDS